MTWIIKTKDSISEKIQLTSACHEKRHQRHKCIQRYLCCPDETGNTQNVMREI